MAIFSPQEIYFGTIGSPDVILDKMYSPATNELIVFINGMLAVKGDAGDYIELDEFTIRFNYQLSDDDVVIIERKNAVNDRIVDVVGETSKSLFKKYADFETLLINQTYTFKLLYRDQEFVEEFQTKIDPLYSTIPTIRNDLGGIMDDIENKRLLYIIYQNSLISQEIASEENLELLNTEPKIPMVFKQFVRYRTEMDLMTSIYLMMSGRQGSVSQILGEFEIKRNNNFNAIGMKDVLQDLKMKLKKAEKALTGQVSTSLVRSAVKGGTDAYPLSSPRRDNLSNVAKS